MSTFKPVAWKEAKALLTGVRNAGNMDIEAWTLLGEVNAELSLYTETTECLHLALVLSPDHLKFMVLDELLNGRRIAVFTPGFYCSAAI